jgi:DNA helicase-2/ATP-dependent DNA helicase PcrA
MLEKLLLQYKFPYEKFGGIKFMEKKHIKDILSFLKVSINPKDEISWFRIFKLYPNIGSVYSKRITDEIIVNGMDELLDEKYRNKIYGKYLPLIHQTIKDVQEMALQDQLEFLIEYRFNLINNIIGLSKKNEASKQESYRDNDEDYKESKMLLDFAEGYSTAESFLTDMTLETPNKNTNEDSFNVTTVHSAKGLEYKVVFVLSCVDGTFPWDFPPKVENERTIRKHQESIEEERRVLYVAITRAKSYLYLMYPKTIFKGGYTALPDISRFLKEKNLDKRFLDEIRVR